MKFTNKEIQFFEIERNIYDLYEKLSFETDKETFDDLNFLLKEENNILEKVLFTISDFNDIDTYINKLSKNLKNFFTDEKIVECILGRLEQYLSNRLYFNPFPKKVDSNYYRYVDPNTKKLLEDNYRLFNYNTINQYCDICYVYSFYYIFQESIKKISDKTIKSMLDFYRYLYLYDNKILESYLNKEIKESELPGLSRLKSFYHSYEDIEKASMNYFSNIISCTINDMFAYDEENNSADDVYITYMDYKTIIQASIRLLSDKNFYSILDIIKDLNQKISDEYTLGKFHNVYPLFLIEDEKRKKQIQLNKIKTV